MTGKLQFRLLISFAFVIFIAIGAVLLMLHQTTRDEIERVRMENLYNLETRMQSELTRFYAINRGWDGVDSLIKQWGNVYEVRIILTGVDNNVIADSNEELTGTYTEEDPGLPVTNFLRTSNTGNLYVTPISTSDFSLESLQLLFGSIGRYFIMGGLIAIALAVLLSYVLSRRVLSPVQALTEAARQLGSGDLKHRVNIKDNGEMGELAETFNSMADNLQRAEELRKNMVADIAHELRTPLTNIKGYLEAARDGVIEANEATIIQLDDEATLLARLVNDLQELSLAEAGRLKLRFETTDILRLIENAAGMTNPAAAQKGVTLTCTLPSSLPSVTIDTDRISQVLRNLINNAIKATPSGGTVDVSALARENEVEVTVSDTGEGIAPEDLSRVFDRFYRVDRSRARATGGSGLGLTIARQLIESHGGKIRAESQVGHGSRFIFTIPLS